MFTSGGQQVVITLLKFLSKMRTKRNIITIFAVIAMGLIATGCKYNELPPKTSDASKTYIKPKGEVPTQAERDEVKAIKAEYEDAVK